MYCTEMNSGKAGLVGLSRRVVMADRAPAAQRHQSHRWVYFGVLLLLGGSAILAGIFMGAFPTFDGGSAHNPTTTDSHFRTSSKQGGPGQEGEDGEEQAAGIWSVDCWAWPQKAPVFAHKVEGMRYPFLISINDLGTAQKPVKNVERMIKGKFFQKPAISQTVQDLLDKLALNRSGTGAPHSGSGGLVVDVGANIGMAAFAASAMGFRVLAFEPVYENVQRLCDGLYLNRVGHLVKLYQAAVSDLVGNITLHKVVGRLDNSAISAKGASLAFKKKEIAPVVVETVTLDSVVPANESVLLLKIDVQGWEYHVLQGAVRILDRPAELAAYVIYEDNDMLLQASGTSSEQILDFMRGYGYNKCIRVGGDRHCFKVAQ